MGVLSGSRSEHRYQLCRDEYCDRFPCRVYREGHRDGWEDSRPRHYQDGYADGYGDGFAGGLASCPGPHGG